MNKEKAQLIYELAEGAISKIKACAYKEQALTDSNSKSIDTLYAQVLNLLEEKRLRAEAFLKRSKE